MMIFSYFAATFVDANALLNREFCHIIVPCATVGFILFVR
jgi:hypothetical protein